jgi:hypothetical protein
VVIFVSADRIQFDGHICILAVSEDVITHSHQLLGCLDLARTFGTWSRVERVYFELFDLNNQQSHTLTNCRREGLL